MFDYARNILAFAGQRIWPVVALLTVSILVELCALMLVLPLVVSIAGNFSTNDTLSGGIFPFLPTELLNMSWSVLLALLAIFLLLRALVSAVYQYSGNTLRFRYLSHLRKLLFQKTVSSHWSFLRSTSTSRLTHSSGALVEDVAEGLSSLLRIFEALFLALVGLLIAAMVSMQLTAALVLLSLIASVPLVFFDRSLYKLRRSAISEMNRIYSLLETTFSGLKTLKSFSLMQEFLNAYDEIAENYSNSAKNVVSHGIIASAIGRAIYGIFLICVLAFSSFADLGTVTPIVVLVLFMRVFPQVQAVQTSARDFVSKVADYNSYQQLLKSLDDNQDLQPRGGRPANDYAIVFQDAGYSYSPKSEVVFNNVSLSVSAGEHIGIVGPSGAGKSTFADMVAGLIPPTSGALQYSEEGEVTSKRPLVSYVTQEEFLFNTSLLENFRLVREDISNEEIFECLELAEASGFVSELSDGLETQVGANGRGFSRGQRQRLCLARSLAVNFDVLLLDEATSAVGPDIESRIYANLKRRFSDRTILAIAHRVAALEWTDRLLVVFEKSIVDSGVPTEIDSAKNSYLDQLNNADLKS